MADGYLKCATCKYWNVEGRLGTCNSIRSELYGRGTRDTCTCEKYEEQKSVYLEKKRILLNAHPDAVITMDRPTKHLPDNYYAYLGGRFWNMTMKIKDQLREEV